MLDGPGLIGTNDCGISIVVPKPQEFIVISVLIFWLYTPFTSLYNFILETYVGNYLSEFE